MPGNRHTQIRCLEGSTPEDVCISHYHGLDGLDGLCPVCEQNKNQINPLERMESVALAAILPPWSYKSELLTPKPKAYHHLPSEGHHPRQGDKLK